MAFNAMKEAAKRLGWKLEPSEPGVGDIFAPVTLTGMDSGIPVRLERRAGSYLFATTAFIDPPLPLAFSISHQGLGKAIAGIAGVHDVEIGDEEFDKTFWITTKNPDELKRLFTPAVKAALLALAASNKAGGFRPPWSPTGFHVSEMGVSLDRIYRGLTITAEDVMLDIPITVAVVRALKDALGK